MLEHCLLNTVFAEDNSKWWHAQDIINSEGTDGMTFPIDIDEIAGEYLRIYNIDINEYINEVTNGEEVLYTTDDIARAGAGIRLEDIISMGAINV